MMDMVPKNSQKGTFNGFMKQDLKQEKIVAKVEVGTSVIQEVMYAAKDNAREEDDGYILTFMQTPENTNNSQFVIYDAKDLKELARLLVPIEYGSFPVHGIYLENDELNNLS